MVINGEVSEWEDVFEWSASKVDIGTTTFLDIYINDINIGIMNSILKFADDTKMYGRVGTDKGIDTLRKDLEAVNVWSEKWQMSFNVDKCKVMHISAKIMQKLNTR